MDIQETPTGLIFYRDQSRSLNKEKVTKLCINITKCTLEQMMLYLFSQICYSISSINYGFASGLKERQTP